ncbi:MAG: hypothetical protein IPK62_17340 [Bacteroidetes bacterium]|nr:hypothetical protein [Bacteroidota bacterium]
MASFASVALAGDHLFLQQFFIDRQSTLVGLFGLLLFVGFDQSISQPDPVFCVFGVRLAQLLHDGEIVKAQGLVDDAVLQVNLGQGRNHLVGVLGFLGWRGLAVVRGLIGWRVGCISAVGRGVVGGAVSGGSAGSQCNGERENRE